MLDRYHLPVWTEYSPEQLCKPMKSDKKRAGDMISFIMLRRIGDFFYSRKRSRQDHRTGIKASAGGTGDQSCSTADGTGAFKAILERMQC